MLDTVQSIKAFANYINNSNQIVLTLSSPLTDQASPDEGGGVVGSPRRGPLGASGGPGTQPVPPQPLFHLDDVNVVQNMPEGLYHSIVW